MPKIATFYDHIVDVSRQEGCSVVEALKLARELGVEAVRRLAPGMAVSVDTFRSEVAARAIERFGPLIINDISAGELDPAMPAVAAKYGVPYIAMHMKGDPKTMQSLTDYKRDITAEVVAYFEARVAALLAAGIAREHLVLDPGFGFAKTTEQNYELLAGLHRLCALGYPVLAGLSRKSMIYRVLGVTPAQSLAGTVALGWECLRQGAAILRVHDVREAVDTVRIFNAYVQNSGEICQMKKYGESGGEACGKVSENGVEKPAGRRDGTTGKAGRGGQAKPDRSRGATAGQAA